ncbi:hypothetical protein [Mesorhizobium sp. 113-3-3]|uniref:hypothetical protein n=1 Tax=Mesorhizobium sp. 113-3-3 TaxID=2744516 RepID=UPI0018ECD14D|nr:hypothetical protein [Mesorhizobium sp. 113-3-3]BCG83507.1 hypothetical protein MesoLj113b_70490 [Mesorhizobium sp. 113-3-3]
MKMSRVLPVVVVLPTLAALSSAPAQADDFGCKVLLCILNPQGWASVGECVPPVERAFRMVAHGEPWPQCPEAGSSGRIGYEEFKPCPDGTIAVSPDAESSGSDNSSRSQTVYKPDSNGAFCAARNATNSSWGTNPRGSGYGTRPTSAVTPREQRTEPNYLDLTTTDGKQRFWFNLSRYQ